MTYRVQVLDRDGRLVRRMTLDAPNQTVARRKVGRVFPQSFYTIRVLKEER